jgi:glycosyltransferase 2 family protein
VSFRRCRSEAGDGASGTAPSGVKAIRKILTTLVRLLVTAGLLWALAARVDLAQAGHILARVSLPSLLAGLAALVVVGLVGAWRWHVILAAETPSPGPGVLAKIVFVGLFFNQVLPSGIGGDAVRVLRCRRLGIGLAAAIRSILIDRVSGYAVFVLLYAATLTSLLHVLADSRQRAAAVMIFIGAVAGAAGLLLFDLLPERLLRLPLLGQIAALSRESRRVFGQPQRAAAVFALSAAAVALNVLIYKALGDGLGHPLPVADWAVVVPPVTLMQLFPVALAGWGVREVGVVVALAGFGVPAEAALAISLLFGLCQLAVGLPGGLIWLSDRDIAAARRGGGLAAEPCGKPGA